VVGNNTGLGDITAATTVTAGAALQVQGGITVNEPLLLGGSGVGLGLAGGGALRNVGGDNVWTGGIGIAGNATTFIGVDSRSSLDISGLVSTVQVSGGSLTKV